MVERDVPGVARLFAEIFRSAAKPDPAILGQYIAAVYLNGPTHDPRIPSLVAIGEDGGLLGFLGGTSARMKLGNEPLRVAICSNLMVARGRESDRDPLLPLRLVRTFLGADQDLSITDTASETARRLWIGCGGIESLPYSLRWIRPLRPFGLSAQFVSPTGYLAHLKPLLRAVARPLDGLAAGVRAGPFRRAESNLDEVPLEAVRLADLMEAVGGHSLRPVYDPEWLEWVIGRAAEKRGNGRLRGAELRNEHLSPVGWYLYFCNRGGVSEVLQLVAQRDSYDEALKHLITEARAAGSLALAGRADPEFASTFSQHHCWLSVSQWTLIHSSQPHLLEPFQNGDALLTGLEGELWMRFVGDPFQV